VRKLLHREQGQALTEFAFLLPVFLLLVIGLFDLGRAVFQLNTLGHAAQDGTRFAIVHGESSQNPVGPGNEAPVVKVVRDAAIGVPDVSVAVAWPDQCARRNCRVAVNATAPFEPVLSQWFGVDLRLTLRAGSMLVIQW